MGRKRNKRPVNDLRSCSDVAIYINLQGQCHAHVKLTAYAWLHGNNVLSPAEVLKARFLNTSQVKQIHTLPPSFSNIHYNVILLHIWPCFQSSAPFHQNLVCISRLPPIPATWPVYLILIHLITQITLKSPHVCTLEGCEGFWNEKCIFLNVYIKWKLYNTLL